MGVSVQVSFYALGGPDLTGAIDRFLDVLRQRGLTHEVGAMSTVIWGDLDEVFAALRDAYEQASVGHATVMALTVSNACPTPSAWEARSG